MRTTSTLLLLVVLLPAASLAQRMVTVSGSVKDEKGSPVAYASVQGKEKNVGTTTDSLGNFKLRLRTGDALFVNAIGFAGDTLKVSEEAAALSIVLHSKVRVLEGITITGADQRGAEGNDPAHTMVTKSAGATLGEFVRTEQSFNGQTQVTPRVGVDGKPLAVGVTGGVASHLDSRQTTFVNAPANTFYNMSAIPAFSIKEGTKGNRYLLGERWGSGYVVTRSDSIVDNKAMLYNFDKIEQKLYTTKDQQTVIELDKPVIKAFAIRDGDSLIIFDRVAVIDADRFFVALVAEVGGKYSLYKNLQTKFIKANYHSDGLVESGNNFDEYKDELEYYILTPQHEIKKVELKKKAIKDALPAVSAQVNAFISAHKYDDVDENYLKKLIVSLN